MSELKPDFVCEQHSRYLGVVSPRGLCPTCWFLYGQQEARRDFLKALEIDAKLGTISEELRPGIRYVKDWFGPRGWIYVRNRQPRKKKI